MTDFQFYQDRVRGFHESLARTTVANPQVSNQASNIPRGQRLSYYDLTQHRLKLRLWRDHLLVFCYA